MVSTRARPLHRSWRARGRTSSTDGKWLVRNRPSKARKRCPLPARRPRLLWYGATVRRYAKRCDEMALRVLVSGLVAVVTLLAAWQAGPANGTAGGVAGRRDRPGAAIPIALATPDGAVASGDETPNPPDTAPA